MPDPSRPPDDPLLAAAIGKLPHPTDGPFPAEARSKWLKLMAMAFDVAYGEVGAVVEIPSFLPSASAPQPTAATPAPAAAPAAPKPAPHAANGVDYYIDRDGFARCDFEKMGNGAQVPSPGRQVTADEVGDEPIYDYRSPRNPDAIIWADNSMGALPGMIFTGPG